MSANTNMQTLKCRFDSSLKLYSYGYAGSKEVKADDYALVKVTSGYETGLKLVKVVSVEEGLSKAVTKMVIDVFSLEQYEAEQKRLDEYRKNKEVAQDKLDRALAKHKQLKQYEDLLDKLSDGAERDELSKALEVLRNDNFVTETEA